MKRKIIPLLTLFLSLFFSMNGSNALGQESKIREIERIGPEEAREKVIAGQALLVCAYDDETCRDILLEGALLRGEFEGRLTTLQKHQEIIFYCG